MKVLETRTVQPGLKRRRYELPDGRRVTTYEVPATVLKALGMKRVREELQAWARGDAARARVALIEQRLREGVKPTAIAHEVGVTEQRVRQVRTRLSQDF